MFSWIRLAIAGVIVAALAAATIAVTSFLKEKDRMVQERDQQIANLRAQVSGLTIDRDRLKESNSSLQADRDRKVEELMRAQKEIGRLTEVDRASNQRLGELDRKLNSRERLEQVERVRNSARAELGLTIYNKSAECELKNFFQAGGECKSGRWVKDGERLVPTAPITQTPPAESKPAGGPRVAQ